MNTVISTTDLRKQLDGFASAADSITDAIGTLVVGGLLPGDSDILEHLRYVQERLYAELTRLREDAQFRADFLNE